MREVPNVKVADLEQEVPNVKVADLRTFLLVVINN